MPPTTVASAPRTRAAANWPVRGAAVAVLVVVACAAWGGWLVMHGTKLSLGGGLLVSGAWEPRLPPAALGAVVLAAVFAWRAVPWSQQVSWRRLLTGSGLAAAAWAVALAITDGTSALAEPLTTEWEYLRDVHRVGAIGPFLSTFTDHVLAGSEGFQWVTHVSGHPPGALLAFAALAKIGLGTPGWAAALCIAAGASAVSAVLVTVRVLAGEAKARAAAPFVAIAPAAIWIATSADALFLGVSAWGICALACASARRDRPGDLLALAGGVLLGGALFLSYGLTLAGILALAVTLGQRRVRPLAVAAIGVAAVFAAFAYGGFWWFDGLAAASERVREGNAWITRPSAYFALVNVAVTALAIGLAGAAGIAAVARDRFRGRTAIMPAAALLAIAAACASNLSKGETERIFLPFDLWLLAATATLPAAHRRRWLIAQLALTIGVQLAVRTNW